MTTAARLEKMWQQDRRYFTRYLLVVAGSVFIHVVLAAMFMMAKRPVLAGLNVGALVFYAIWFYLFTRRPVSGPMLVALYLDVVVHACIYNLLLGQQTAFFLYPFIITPVTFFLSTRDLKKHNSLLASVALSMLSLSLIHI